MTVRKASLSAATERFITSVESDLIETDLPAISQLRLLSAQLDTDPSVSSLHGQYGLTYRDLVKRLELRKTPAVTDPLEALLQT
ncbi:hypothetical protein [Curtobacterium flaccumfaciens]|uniref:hypothetical protein n=1 Tax=Curtobacterium flaccumfaciens TaxID=2035 RepID=UPI0011296B51|nr:hypothetical protein [Curtobacterium flaccumfaciens]TPG09388.1 hypothetical protein EAH85_03760 [Curtobacterium flaccumfaciens]